MPSDTPIITHSRLKRDLQAIGLAPGQTVMLHIALSSIGWVVGGADTVIRALLDVLTPGGTLMMYIAWEDRTDHWQQWSPQQQEAYRQECPAFDPQRSRAYRNWSIVTEYLRTWPGAYRSANPGASMAAVGAQAQWLTADHPLHYGYGLGSPFAKLCELQGYVLQIGVSPGTLSLIHHAEDLANLPNKRIFRYPVPLLQDGVRTWVTIEEYDTGDGVADWLSSDYLDQIALAFQEAGYSRAGLIGAAQSYLCQAVELRDFAIEWLESRSA